jgi:hypothetical protein
MAIVPDFNCGGINPHQLRRIMRQAETESNIEHLNNIEKARQAQLANDTEKKHIEAKRKYDAEKLRIQEESRLYIIKNTLRYKEFEDKFMTLANKMNSLDVELYNIRYPSGEMLKKLEKFQAEFPAQKKKLITDLNLKKNKLQQTINTTTQKYKNIKGDTHDKKIDWVRKMYFKAIESGNADNIEMWRKNLANINDYDNIMEQKRQELYVIDNEISKNYFKQTPELTSEMIQRIYQIEQEKKIIYPQYIRAQKTLNGYIRSQMQK